MPDTIHGAKSVTSALQILTCFSEQNPELGIAEIAAMLRSKPSTVHRLLAAMETEGFVLRNARTSKYRLGLKVLELARVVLNSFEVRREAIPMLAELAQRTGASANLAVLDGHDVVYLARTPSPHIPDNYFHGGRRVPVHCTALGKVLLAFSPPEVRQRYLRTASLPKLTDTTITEASNFDEELNAIRERGYAVDLEEYMTGTTCVAAPVFDASGTLVAAVSLSNTGTRIDPEALKGAIDDLQEVANKVSYRLGYSLYNPWAVTPSHRRKTGRTT